MAPGLSLYLDFFRVTVVLIVVISHAFLTQMGGDWFKYSLWLEALEATFVLSGFAIAYVVATRERNVATFGAARLARLWSVLLPALALTPLIDAAGFRLSPAPYENWGLYVGFDNPLLRVFLNAIFQSQTWFLAVTPFSNIPAWTMGFVAWYYAIFAAFAFSPRRWRIWTVGAVALMAGPKILALMPGWILGAWIYKNHAAIKLSRAWGLACFLGGPALILVLKAMHLSPWLFFLELRVFGVDFVTNYLTLSQDFLWQNLVGVLIGVHFVGAIALGESLGRLLGPTTRVIRNAAALTLAVYLLHFPLELFIAAALHDHPDGPLKTALIIIGALAVSAAIGAALRPLYPWLRLALLRALRRSGYGPAKGLQQAE